MTTLVSAKSTCTQKTGSASTTGGAQTHHSDEGWSHLKHLLSKQVVPHLPLDVPVHQVTLKTRRETVEMSQSDVRPKLLHPYVTSPSGRGGCRRAPKDL